MAETAELTGDHVDRFLREIEGELPPIDLEVEGIVERIWGLNKRFLRLSEETMADFGLSEGEWKVLKHLRKAGPPYRRSAGQLARRIELSSGAMTNRLDRMEEAGLIRRLPDPDDRRAVQVELTDAGRRAWDDTISVQAAKEALVAEALNAKEKQQLNDLLRRLMLEFERR
ncbi:MAG TPA: MarR family transcriptional regulator [Gaiellaceae bacterium]|jgi:DNA-binding MarR family transcriptional regulator|nr:MarR family transcriptional regulator [Gaiellaceae bacterium]